MTFGWLGFQLDHPEEWSPVVMTGDRREGYVRIASPGRLACQVRWRTVRGAVKLETSVDTYLSRLREDARKAKAEFRSDVHRQGEQVAYSYKGAYQGRGAAFTADDSRVFFLEVIGGRNDSLLTPFRQVQGSFSLGDPTLDRWSLYGLDVVLPRGLRVGKKLLQAGRTRMELEGRGTSVVLDRWGFAEQLIDRHGLTEWAQSLLGMQAANAQEETCGLRLRKERGFGAFREALVAPQIDRNQIVVVDVTSRNPDWRPTWDWLI